MPLTSSSGAESRDSAVTRLMRDGTIHTNVGKSSHVHRRRGLRAWACGPESLLGPCVAPVTPSIWEGAWDQPPHLVVSSRGQLRNPCNSKVCVLGMSVLYSR